MDVIGFAFGTTVLVTVLAIFGIVGRIVNGVACEIRWTLAPTMIDGVRAWGELLEARRSLAAPTSPDDAGGPGASDGGPDVDRPTEQRDRGDGAPVQAVSGRVRLLATLAAGQA